MGKSYTGTGDDGTTARFGGQRESKAGVIPAACGAVDEANSLIGVALSNLRAEKADELGTLSAADRAKAEARIEALQHILFRVGADVATPNNKKTPAPRISKADTEALEERIDALDAVLPELSNFILPGGTKAAATLHLARSVIRRAERTLVAAREANEELNEELFPFLNRLSSYLFALARWVNWRAAADETPPDYQEAL